jgi:hypothetical protein
MKIILDHLFAKKAVLISLHLNRNKDFPLLYHGNQDGILWPLRNLFDVAALFRMLVLFSALSNVCSTNFVTLV